MVRPVLKKTVGCRGCDLGQSHTHDPTRSVVKSVTEAQVRRFFRPVSAKIFHSPHANGEEEAMSCFRAVGMVLTGTILAPF